MERDTNRETLPLANTLQNTGSSVDSNIPIFCKLTHLCHWAIWRLPSEQSYWAMFTLLSGEEIDYILFFGFFGDEKSCDSSLSSYTGRNLYRGMVQIRSLEVFETWFLHAITQYLENMRVFCIPTCFFTTLHFQSHWPFSSLVYNPIKSELS